ncbi:hypothetical protein [Persicitalea jodogahamensis]|uniref:Long-chain fatty acid transport protein n=1 Tax=Persicitalea jodogahamensis TaxID=402147 RepID=A0A8J3DCT2_9BACT|nr:hypothetical protein [Persicitalea jodogahamensis]GHB77541.1 hypothetical protein GCM10007390_34640 [Persicitalea jodogahamensis]
MSIYRNNKSITALVIGALIFVGSNASVQAQGLGNSPYSVLGVGESYSDAFSTNQGMGGAGVSTSNGIHINNLNPALWVRNRYTTFEFGAISQYKEIKAPNASQRDFGANIGYLALSLPAGKRWSLGLSLKPYSFVDFESRSSGKVSGTIYDTYYYYSGKGAINQVSLTNAFQLGKYVSVGLESSYLFGNVRRASESQLLIGDGADYLVSRTERNSYSDFFFRAGTAVRIPIKKDNKLNLNLGGTYSFGTDLKARQTTSFELTNNSFAVGLPDTLSNNAKGGIHLPSQYRIGASLEWPYKLTLAVDYSRQNWSQYRSFAGNNDGLVDAGRVHLGLEYIPDLVASAGYFKKVEYRLGFSTGSMPYSPDGAQLKDTNLSIGGTFPVGLNGNSPNSFTLSFIAGQRGVVSNQAIQERYGKIVLGITLVDNSWFSKVRID